MVYEAECKECRMHYIRSTQQKLKASMGQNFIETKNLVNRGKSSDSFAAHVASYFEGKYTKKVENIAIKDVRNLVKIK